MTLESRKKLAKHIFRLLKVSDIVFTIGRTNKGNLGLRFNENSEDFDIYLDAVPLSTKDILVDDNNIELKRMIEKYWFGNETVSMSYAPPTSTKTVSTGAIAPKKKGGRPKGSKNKIKHVDSTPEKTSESNS